MKDLFRINKNKEIEVITVDEIVDYGNNRAQSKWAASYDVIKKDDYFYKAEKKNGHAHYEAFGELYLTEEEAAEGLNEWFYDVALNCPNFSYYESREEAEEALDYII